MPVHDWTRVDAGVWQDFRSGWIVAISNQLNKSKILGERYALLAPAAFKVNEIIEAPGTLPFYEPWQEMPCDDEMEFYRLRKNHVVVRRTNDDRAVAVVEVVSAGDKATIAAVGHFVNRTKSLLDRGVHLLIIDLLKPMSREPQGIHKLIWDEFQPESPQLPPAKPLAVAAFVAGSVRQAFVEPVAVGDELPTLPLFLTYEEYVDVPLEATYQAAFAAVPEYWREALSGTA